MFKLSKKEDLIALLTEISETPPVGLTVIQLKTGIEESKAFKDDPDFVKSILESIIEERKLKEENAIKGREMQLELEKIKLAQLEKEVELQRARNENKNEPVNFGSEIISNSYNLENLIRSMRTLTIPIPEKSENFNLFFQVLERAFITKMVPDDLKAEILINLLGDKAKNILFYINERDIKSYDTVKSLVLKEFQPTAIECLTNFRKAKRELNETHIQFVSRLSANFQYYCSLREVNDFESLCQLIISDKLFQTLDKETSSYINVKIGEGWLRPRELAREIDIYFVNKERKFGEVNQVYENPYGHPECSRESEYIPPSIRNHSIKNKYPPKDCYICGEFSHLAKFCPNRIKSRNDKQTSLSEREYVSENKCDDKIIANINSLFLTANETNNPLQRVHISVEGKSLSSIVDSGAQISVLSPKYFPTLLNRKGDEKAIDLVSAFGKKISAYVSQVPISLTDENNSNFLKPIKIFAAICEKLHVPAIITPSDYELMLSAKAFLGPDESLLVTQSNVRSKEEICDLTPLQSGDDGINNLRETFFCSPMDESERNRTLLSTLELPIQQHHSKVLNSQLRAKVIQMSDANELKLEQDNCQSLHSVRENLRFNKGNYILIDDLSYHKDRISGEQGVKLPECRQVQVGKQTHGSVSGNYLRSRKTGKRIKHSSYYWPTITRDVRQICQTCNFR